MADDSDLDPLCARTDGCHTRMPESMCWGCVHVRAREPHHRPGEVAPSEPACQRPPEGWYCTRGADLGCELTVTPGLNERLTEQVERLHDESTDLAERRAYRQVMFLLGDAR